MKQTRVVLITGASGGLGRAMAKQFAKEKSSLVLWDVVKPEAMVKQLSNEGVSLLADEVDITSMAEVDSAVTRAMDRFGRIDVLVNNAGITKDALLFRMKEDEWDRVLSVNLKGAFVCCKIVARMMWKQRSGRIINVASIIGEIGNVGQANYAASKAGLIALTKTCAKEFARSHVTVNAIAPGYILTPMTEKLPETVRNQMLERIPLGRFGTPEDVAAVTAFLASDHAAYLTGQVIRIDGGLVM
ncbi:MAG: 3-oxoacyl-[acyl-carrier-protein] reductase [Candidatus Ratteibacteria bacterium]|jgi:3-oxoacyl-[acyl-carrier protein] reductase